MRCGALSVAGPAETIRSAVLVRQAASPGTGRSRSMKTNPRLKEHFLRMIQQEDPEPRSNYSKDSRNRPDRSASTLTTVPCVIHDPERERAAPRLPCRSALWSTTSRRVCLGYRGTGCAGGPRKSPLREGPKFGHLAGEKIGRLPKPMAPLTLTADETADVIQCRASLGKNKRPIFQRGPNAHSPSTLTNQTVITYSSRGSSWPTPDAITGEMPPSPAPWKGSIIPRIASPLGRVYPHTP
jgi:hypothetical protein